MLCSPGLYLIPSRAGRLRDADVTDAVYDRASTATRTFAETTARPAALQRPNNRPAWSGV